MRVLHLASEAFPYVKVGGLSDVLGALPPALRAIDVDARLLLPGFPGVLRGAAPLTEARGFSHGLPGAAARLLRGTTNRGVPLYVVDAPNLFARSEDPYADFGDSHLGAAALSRAAVEIARDGDGSGWSPELLHCHDWQTGLAPAYVGLGGVNVRTVFTIHNIAYQGHYPRELLSAMWLPPEAFHPKGVEFWGGINLLKAALVYAGRITTVSPTYAREILTPEAGNGLDGVLRERAADVRGILNGVDEEVWDPATSAEISRHYDLTRLRSRTPNKSKLQRELGLDVDEREPLFGAVSRLNDLKGSDLVLANADHVVRLGAELAVVGRGDPALERAFGETAVTRKGRVAFFGGQNEGLAHRVFAGADFVLVPSRSEPCGLVQLYAMRYGAVPVARFTGGLADTVRDESLGREANGFTFDAPDASALGEVIARAVRVYHENRPRLRELQRAGMARDSGWGPSAKAHRAVYAELLR